MEHESCRNCANYPGCLIRGAAIFCFFILTEQDRELPEGRENFNARGLCGPHYQIRKNETT